MSRRRPERPRSTRRPAPKGKKYHRDRFYPPVLTICRGDAKARDDGARLVQDSKGNEPAAEKKKKPKEDSLNL